MPTYKTFWVDRRTNFVRSETVEASNDDQALSFANRSDRGVRQEIWDGGRFVGSVELSGGQNRLMAAKRRPI